MQWMETPVSAHTHEHYDRVTVKEESQDNNAGFPHYTGMIPYLLIETGKANNVPEPRAKYYRLK